MKCLNDQSDYITEVEFVLLRELQDFWKHFKLPLPDLCPALSFPPPFVGGWLPCCGGALVDYFHAGAAVESAPPPAGGDKE